MKDEKLFKFDIEVLAIPFLMLFAIWFVYWIELQFGFNFNKYGIYPKSIIGLRGILCSPFIHSGTSHLVNNSIPLVVLSIALFYFYRKVAFTILVIGTLFTGLLTWILADDSYHIGASGVVYLLFSFIFFSGIFRKYYRLIALSLAVIFLYGSMVWYVFPIKDHMSWEGHLSGFLTGMLLAFIYRKIGPQKPTYQFKQTEFDLLFDEQGNFNPPIIEEPEKNTEDLN